MRWFPIFLAALIAFAPSVTDAGTFQIDSVSYRTTASSDGTATIVWVRATARYVGEVDSNDNSWALQTELIALGSVTDNVRPGSGVSAGLIIDNEPVTSYGIPPMEETGTASSMTVIPFTPSSAFGFTPSSAFGSTPTMMASPSPPNSWT